MRLISSVTIIVRGNRRVHIRLLLNSVKGMAETGLGRFEGGDVNAEAIVDSAAVKRLVQVWKEGSERVALTMFFRLVCTSFGAHCWLLGTHSLCFFPLFSFLVSSVSGLG